jgi:hypothetical protein
LLIGVAAMLVIATVLVVTRGRDGSPPTMSPANEGAPAREATATKQDAGPAKREDTLSAKPDAAAPPTPRNAAPPGPAMPESGKSASSASVNGSMNPAVAAPPKPAAIASPPSTGAADRASTESVRGPAVSQPARPNDGKPKPSATATTSAEKSPTGPSSPRCSRILQKAAVGEPLTPEENRELVNTCR